MKKLIFFAFTAFFAVACNTKDGKSENKGSDSTKMADSKTEKLDFPYTLDRPYQNWQPGDQQHAVNVMKSLKAWETNNIAESVSYFGDSVELRFDNYREKLSHDSLASQFAMWRNDNASVTIKMIDWESVISSDKKEEWVTLWYKQIWTDKKGKTDSLSVIDDAKIVNGKIVVLDEKIQHYPAEKE